MGGYPCQVRMPDGSVCGRKPYGSNDLCSLHAQAPEGLAAKSSSTTTTNYEVRVSGTTGGDRSFFVQEVSDGEGRLESVRIISPNGRTDALEPGEESLLGLLETCQAIAAKHGLLRPPKK